MRRLCCYTLLYLVWSVGANGVAAADGAAAACGNSNLLQVDMIGATASVATEEVETAFVFVAMQDFAKAQSTRATVESLASLGKFSGHVLLISDMPDCLVTTLTVGSAAARNSVVQADAQGQTAPSTVESQFRAYATVALRGLKVHIIQVPYRDLRQIDIKLEKTYVWDAARAVGLEPRQLIYLDADIVVAEPLQDMLRYLDGDATVKPQHAPSDQMSDEELDLLDMERRGEPLPLWIGGVRGGPDGESTIQTSTPAAAKDADMAVFAALLGGDNPRHGGFFVSRRGSGEHCLQKWREAIMAMLDDDPELRKDQPALGKLDCNFAYLPWQWIHFPTMDTVQLGRREHFVHFTGHRLKDVIKQTEPVMEWFAGIGLDQRYASPFGANECYSKYEPADEQ